MPLQKRQRPVQRAEKPPKDDKPKRGSSVLAFLRSARERYRNRGGRGADESVDRQLGPSFPKPGGQAAPDTVGRGPGRLSGPSAREQKQSAELLDEHAYHAIFFGAPHFALEQKRARRDPVVSFPWDTELNAKDSGDAAGLPHQAFYAATLRPHAATFSRWADARYDVGVLEVPSMLSAHGREPGTVGFDHFLQLPTADSSLTDLQQSESSNGVLDALRNKELLQSNPERLGIRRVDMSMVHHRLIEFGDLYEVYQDSRGRTTLLDNQSPGDLHGNLFGKFLTPLPHDSETSVPTGIRVQIVTLFRILGLKGVWFDFSLVEWRIRLGRILWSYADLYVEDDTAQADDANELWSDRDMLLLQICLSCELFFRLDAVASMDESELRDKAQMTKKEREDFAALQTAKTDWDLVLARCFVENILVVADSPKPPGQGEKHGVFSVPAGDVPGQSPKPDVSFYPRHQARQLAGLEHFANALCWPGRRVIGTELGCKLHALGHTSSKGRSAYGRFWEPTTPSSISVYATPLATPRSGESVQSSYFGSATAKPALSRSSTSRALDLALASTPSPPEQTAPWSPTIGGWLSRSFLTGLVLPGEALQHFLMSTLLENDKLAIAALGDSANLYGGFVYAERSWWSRHSIVGRVLACVDGAAECMGWVSIPKLPKDAVEGWYAINSAPMASEQPRIRANGDLVARDSSLWRGEAKSRARLWDFNYPLDRCDPPLPSISFVWWTLHPAADQPPSRESTASTATSLPRTESQVYTATLTFRSRCADTHPRFTTHGFSLLHDVQFISSYPCYPLAASSAVPAQTGALSSPVGRSDSKRSARSARSSHSQKRLSRHPSRRNAAGHGFEPLLSHPPDSATPAPLRMWSPEPPAAPDGGEETPHAVGVEPGFSSSAAAADEDVRPAPLMPGGLQRPGLPAHPLHVAYKYRIEPAPALVDPAFGFPRAAPRAVAAEVLVLDARGHGVLALLARAWCAQTGHHALVARASRTCLGCSVREASGLGVAVVIRV